MSSKAHRMILARVGYERTRLLLSVVGTGLLLVIAAIMAARGVDRIEIIAALLYVPLFLTIMFTGLKGGLLAGVAAAAMYIGMRWSAIAIVGTGQFFGLVGFRSIAYLAFGGLGGWAAQHLESPLRKLEDHDLIDDATGLFNARFFVRQTKLESSRADRYGTPYSVVLLSLPPDAFPRTRSNRAPLGPVTDLLQSRIRTVDRAVHADSGDEHLFALILPETPAEGAAVVARNLTSSVEDLTASGTAVTTSTATYPGSEETLAAIRDRFERIDRMEHPMDVEEARAG